MVCPHCSFENPPGRKYCRSCAKPLPPAASSEKPTPSPSASLPTTKPQLSKIALASLILSVFSLIAPFGIAAVVLAHISRSQIAKSRGHLTGTWPAFAALLLGYSQLAVVLLLSLAAAGFLVKFNKELGRDQWTRAALVEHILYGDPHRATKTDEINHQQYVLEALRIVRARQRDYLAAHPSEGYACRLDQLGYQLTEDSELHTLLINSRYDLQIFNCRTPNLIGAQFALLAIPRSDSNLPDSPAYCLDSSEIIHRYNSEQARNAVARVAGRDHELCSPDGENVY